MKDMLELSTPHKLGLNEFIKISGLLIVYQFTLHKWINDESKDLSKTMAALDAALRHSQAITSWLLIK